MTPVLSLSDVSIRYGTHLAVDRLSLQVNAGEIYGLLGPNGSGKSSTLAAISANLVPANGDIRVCGLCELDAPLDYRRRIGLVPQELAFYDSLTALDNVCFFGRLYGLCGGELTQRAAAVLEFVRLADQAQRVPRTFSGGMQRRLNLACALMHRPALLLLDEPTVGLDIQSRDAIFASLRELASQGTALVFTTHHLEEAEQLCSRIGIMHDGRLVAEGTVAELDARWRPHSANAPHAPNRLEGVFLRLTSSSKS
jgi:ABC-2 type transport system ATP-binding protein